MAYADREDLNYLGMLYEIGANQTPFLNLVGGVGGAVTSRSFDFPVAQPYSLATASQPSISEADSVSSNTATTITRGQDTNTAQIFQYTVEVSHAKQSTTGEFGGIQVLGEQPVTDELDFQAQAQFRQLSIDLEYSMFQGVYQQGVNATTAAQMRGIIPAVTTNAVAAGATALDKALMDEMFREMATNGAQFDNVVVFCNAFQKQKISDVYGTDLPRSRTEGGINIEMIMTDFGEVGVVYAPQMPTDTVVAVELSVCRPVFVPYEGQLIVLEDLAQVAASRKQQWYAQIGLDYGPEEYHGKITGLTTS